METSEYAIIFIAAGVVETAGHPAVGALTNLIYEVTLQV